MELKEIPLHPEYKITKSGQVWSTRTNKWRKPYTANKHLHILFRVNRVSSTRSVGSLVLETFVSSRPEGLECRHLDGNPLNNNLDNLAWGTRQENVADRVIHGTNLRGERNGNSKLTDRQAAEIRQCLANDIPPKVLAKHFQVNRVTIYNIKNQKTYEEGAGL